MQKMAHLVGSGTVQHVFVRPVLHQTALQWPLRRYARLTRSASLATQDLPKVSLGELVHGHLRWLLVMAVGAPIWAYQGSLALLAVIFAREQFFARTDREGVEYPEPPGFEHRFIHANGLRFHTVTAGRGRGKPLMLFLHGFPELWYSWRRQLEEFAADYECVAIDMRGFNLSDKPPGRTAYRVDVITEDVAALVVALGHQRCTLVAHDWGGIISWFTTALHPHLVERLVVLGIPHPIAGTENAGLAQLRRSWYVFFFQFPFLPEALSLAADCKFISDALRDGAIAPRRARAITDEDIERYKQAFARPGAARAAIDYYRSYVDGETRAPSARYLEAKRRLRAGLGMPVLMVYGGADTALGPELIQGSEKYLPDLELHVLDGCSHWVQQERWEDINCLMRGFLARRPLGDPPQAAPGQAAPAERAVSAS